MTYLNRDFIKLAPLSKLNPIKKYFFYGALAVLMFSLSSQAKDVSKDSCNEAITQKELNQCYYQQFKKVDTELNRLYQELTNRLKAASALDNPQVVKDSYYLGLLTKLKESQRIWIKFRDAECDIAAFGVRPGSVEPMIYSICLSKMTEKRNEDLRYYLNCEGNDFSCPFPTEEYLK